MSEGGVKSSLRVVGGFLAVYFPAVWVEVWIRTGESSHPAEVIFGWLILLGGWVWILALLTAAPFLSAVAALYARRDANPRRGLIRRFAAGIAIGFVSLVVWGSLLGAPGGAIWMVRFSPTAAFLALGFAGVWGTVGAHPANLRPVGVVLASLGAASVGYHLVMPAVAPAFTYEYLGNGVRNVVAVRVLRETQPGDSVAMLDRRLPGFVPSGALNGEASWQSGMLGAGFNYQVTYRGGVVDSIRVGGSLQGD